MRFLFTILIFCISALAANAQSDLLVLKKNGRTIQSFFPGSEIYFYTKDRAYNAYVTSVDRDSVFLVQYDIKKLYTNLGIYILDTGGRYQYAIAYKEIAGFVKERGNFLSGSGAALMGGGVVLTTAGLITWIFAKPNTRYYARPGFVITSAALAGVGYLLTKTGSKKIRLGKKYTLHYIKVK